MNYLLEATKEQLRKTTEELSFSNISSIKKRILKQIAILEYAASVEEEDGAHMDSSEDTIVPEDTHTDIEVSVVTEAPEEDQPVNEDVPEDKPEDTPAPDSNIHLDTLASVFDDNKKPLPFHKNLSGGHLLAGSPSDNVFVPESVIRETGMEEGDLVTYEPISGNRFFFEIVDTTNRTLSKIETFNYGIVEYDKSIKQYYVEEDINKRPLKIDYVPQRFMISDRDEKVFGLQMGDIVDLSWYEGNFSKGKVNWKHRTEDLPDKEETVSSKIKNHSSPKETSPKESIDPLLQGKIITLIGLEPYWAKYKQLVEERGGTLWTHSSTDHKVSRTASIRKSDLVIVGISHTSHDASQHAAKKAKEKKTRFASMDGYGGTTFLMTVYDKLNIKDAIA